MSNSITQIDVYVVQHTPDSFSVHSVTKILVQYRGKHVSADQIQMQCTLYTDNDSEMTTVIDSCLRSRSQTDRLISSSSRNCIKFIQGSDSDMRQSVTVLSVTSLLSSSAQLQDLLTCTPLLQI